jgi:hypothetical protein
LEEWQNEAETQVVKNHGVEINRNCLAELLINGWRGFRTALLKPANRPPELGQGIRRTRKKIRWGTKADVHTNISSHHGFGLFRNYYFNNFLLVVIYSLAQFVVCKCSRKRCKKENITIKVTGCDFIYWK